MEERGQRDRQVATSPRVRRLLLPPDDLQPRKLKTVLKFFKTETNESKIWSSRLDYDLSDPAVHRRRRRPDHRRPRLHQHVVHHRQSPTVAGVRVRTRKVAHISGLRPYTRSGSSASSVTRSPAMEMLFGRAIKAEAGSYPWDDPTVSGRQIEPGRTTPQPNPTGAVGQFGGVDDHHDGGRMRRGSDGQAVRPRRQVDVRRAEVADVAEYSAEVGARLASDPWNHAGHRKP